MVISISDNVDVITSLVKLQISSKSDVYQGNKELVRKGKEGRTKSESDE